MNRVVKPKVGSSELRFSTAILPRRVPIPVHGATANRIRLFGTQPGNAYRLRRSPFYTSVGLVFFGTVFFIPCAILHGAEKKYPDCIAPQMQSMIAQISSLYTFNQKISFESDQSRFEVSKAFNRLLNIQEAERVEAVSDT